MQTPGLVLAISVPILFLVITIVVLSTKVGQIHHILDRTKTKCFGSRSRNIKSGDQTGNQGPRGQQIDPAVFL